jgi:hypothetical protein
MNRGTWNERWRGLSRKSRFHPSLPYPLNYVAGLPFELRSGFETDSPAAVVLYQTVDWHVFYWKCRFREVNEQARGE